MGSTLVLYPVLLVSNVSFQCFFMQIQANMDACSEFPLSYTKSSILYIRKTWHLALSTWYTLEIYPTLIHRASPSLLLSLYYHFTTAVNHLHLKNKYMLDVCMLVVGGEKRTWSFWSNRRNNTDTIKNENTRWIALWRI